MGFVVVAAAVVCYVLCAMWYLCVCGGGGQVRGRDGKDYCNGSLLELEVATTAYLHPHPQAS